METRLYSAQMLEIACHIERQGVEFYRKAAERVSDEPTARLMLDLADMEDEHLETFTDMKAQLPVRAATAAGFDAAAVMRYLHAVTNGQVIDLSGDPCERLSGQETPHQLLRIAIDIEKESVVLYAGLQCMALGYPSWRVAENILKEELGHIAELAERLESLGEGGDPP